MPLPSPKIVGALSLHLVVYRRSLSPQRTTDINDIFERWNFDDPFSARAATGPVCS